MNNGKLKSVSLAALSAAVLLTGCGKIDGNATVVTVKNGDTTDTISLGYANFAARYQQSMYDQYLLGYYGEGMWTSDMSGSGSTLEEETKEGVLEDLEEQYLAKAHAADYNISLTDEQTKKIDDAVEKFLAANSKETLDIMGATTDTVKEYLTGRTYYTLVSEAAKKAEGANISEDDCWMRTFTYVLFDTTGNTDEDGNLVEYTDEELAELKANAEALVQSEDFDTDVEKYGVTSSTYSYLKGETEDNTMDMAIIKAVESLKEGEVSSVIEIDGVGYYVLRLDADHDEEASESKKTTLESEAFTALMDSWKDEITWTVDEKVWAEVKFDSLFKAPEQEEEADTSAGTTEEAAEESVSEEETTEETSGEAAEETETTDDTAEENAESDEN